LGKDKIRAQSHSLPSVYQGRYEKGKTDELVGTNLGNSLCRNMIFGERPSPASKEAQYYVLTCLSTSEHVTSHGKQSHFRRLKRHTDNIPLPLAGDMTTQRFVHSTNYRLANCVVWRGMGPCKRPQFITPHTGGLSRLEGSIRLASSDRL